MKTFMYNYPLNIPTNVCEFTSHFMNSNKQIIYKIESQPWIDKEHNVQAALTVVVFNVTEVSSSFPVWKCTVYKVKKSLYSLLRDGNAFSTSQ